MAIEETVDHFKNKAYEIKDKSGDWPKDRYHQLEEWAKADTQQSKQLLLEEAKKHGVKVSENMSAGEIKNKIKAKLRESPPK